MAQSMKSKIRKLAYQYNIDSIIQTAIDVRNDMLDEQAWNNMTDQEKTDWFLNQCKQHNLTVRFNDNKGKIPSRYCVNELPSNTNKAYFTVFLAHDGEPWHLEIGGSLSSNNNGGIWPTAVGLKGKERQIAEVIRLHNLGE